METTRRDLLTIGTALTALGALASPAAISKAPDGLLEILHVYSDAQGDTHMRRVQVHGSKPLPVTEIMAGSIGTGQSQWGTAPKKRFSINITGELDVELSDGTHHHIGKGDLVFVDDLNSKGHRSTMLTPVANLFLIVPEDFNLLSWAAAPA